MMVLPSSLAHFHLFVHLLLSKPHVVSKHPVFGYRIHSRTVKGHDLKIKLPWTVIFWYIYLISSHFSVPFLDSHKTPLNKKPKFHNYTLFKNINKRSVFTAKSEHQLFLTYFFCKLGSQPQTASLSQAAGKCEGGRSLQHHLQCLLLLRATTFPRICVPQRLHSY